MACLECGKETTIFSQGLCNPCYEKIVAEEMIIDNPIPDMFEDEEEGVEEHPLFDTQENEYEADDFGDDDFNEGLYGDDTFFD